nr:MAG TPA: hypothetical protein [Caudoviricetes sp.]
MEIVIFFLLYLIEETIFIKFHSIGFVGNFERQYLCRI